MKRGTSVVLAIVFLTGAFFVGSWYGRRGPEVSNGGDKRKVLYYIDPMNPTHISDQPGIAPCGMKFEPVYEEGSFVSPDMFPPGTVNVTPEKQQAIGVKLGTAEVTAETHTIRTLGTVAVDESRVYVLNATIDGWIQEIHASTTGSLVKKDDILASFYSPEFLSAEQGYLFILNALDRAGTTSEANPGAVDEGSETDPEPDPEAGPAAVRIRGVALQQYMDTLRNLGMSERQLEELGQTRKRTQKIYITAPATSFVISRNITAGQKFDKGVEWFRLADLSRVWIMADLYEKEVGEFRPGTIAKVSLPHRQKVFEAIVGDVLPQFDAKTRTHKVRLEVNNPDFILRPDMFVDVELPVSFPPAVTVPVDAVLDSGSRKIVFVDRGYGYFEPREVVTGRRLDERVEIREGLSPGEQIVVSGNFLIDSESRMRLAAAGMYGELAKDPVCNKYVAMNKAKAKGLVGESNGRTHYFCSPECKKEFDANKTAPPNGKPHDHSTPSGQAARTPAKEASDPGTRGTSEGGMRVEPNHSMKNNAGGLMRGAPPHAVAPPDPRNEVKYIDTGENPTDPVCGMPLDPNEHESPFTVEHLGTTHTFCSEYCRKLFLKSPEKFLNKPEADGPPGKQAPNRIHGFKAGGAHD